MAEEPSGDYRDAPLEEEVETQKSVGCLIGFQGTIQTYLRPATWIPGCRTPHSYEETWSVSAASVDEWLMTLKKACFAADRSETNHGTGKRLIWHTSSISAKQIGFARIQCYTRAGWLDLLEFNVRQSNFEPGRLNVIIHGYSTGLVPLSIPGALILNVAFFFCPFDDHGFQAIWMRSLRDSGAPAIVVDSKRMI
jgi:hypothetical protein